MNIKLASSCLSVCPSVHLFVYLSARNNSAPTERILMKFDIWVFFWKPVKKILFSLKSDKISRYFTWRRVYICDNTSLNCSSNEKYFRQNLWRKSRHFMFNNVFRKCAFYEIMWKNMTQPDRPQIAMRIASWITKVTDTHSEYVILIVFSLRERASMLRWYVNFLSSYFKATAAKLCSNHQQV